MFDNVVLQAVQRSNRLFLALGLAVALAVAAGVYLDQRQLISFFSGPREISSQELTKLGNADMVTRYWVTVKGDNVIDTGWQSYLENDSGVQHITSAYAALSVGKRYLLVEVPHAITDQSSLPQTYTGALTNIPDDVNNQVIADIRSQNADAAALFLPVMLDASDFRSSIYLPLILIAVGVLISLGLLATAARRFADPYRHPILKSLARYGDPQSLSNSISLEMSANHTKVGTVHVTPHWLIVQDSGNFKIARLQDVVWVYQKVTQHRTYGIPTRKTYAGQVWDRYSKLVTFSGSDMNVAAGLKAIMQGAGWAIGGYSVEINQAWRQKHAEFLAAVDQRRAEIEER